MNSSINLASKVQPGSSTGNFGADESTESLIERVIQQCVQLLERWSCWEGTGSTSHACAEPNFYIPEGLRSSRFKIHSTKCLQELFKAFWKQDSSSGEHGPNESRHSNCFPEMLSDLFCCSRCWRRDWWSCTIRVRRLLERWTLWKRGKTKLL